MNSTRGTLAILMTDFKLYILIFWSITILQGFLMMFIGMFVDSENGIGVVLGSLYGGIIAFSALLYAHSYRPAISLGSTRPQYLKIFSWLVVAFTLSSVLMLNVVYYVIHILHEKNISSAYIFHPGMAIRDYHFGAYLWFDILIAFGLAGITIVMTSAIFKYGFLRIAVIGMILSIIVTIGLKLGDAGSLFYTLFVERLTTTLHAFGLIGAVLISLNVLLMRHAPLTYNSRNG